MRLWLYRWPNGDTSIVVAGNRLDAVDVLDEWGAAEPKDLIPLTFPHAIDFKITDEGEIELGDGFTEELGLFIHAKCYPLLEQALIEGEGDEPDLELVKKAVLEERERVEDKPEEAKTPEGKVLAAAMGMSGPLADRYARKRDKQRLRDMPTPSDKPQ